MAKKLVSVAALWLALAALVFIYTDRDEYTWRYEEDTLSQILIGGEEAERSEQDYEVFPTVGFSRSGACTVFRLRKSLQKFS